VAAHSGTNVASLVPLYLLYKAFSILYILRSEKARLVPEQIE